MTDRPDILVVMADQFRAMAIEPGGDPVATPHLDRRAADGCRVTQAVSSYPVCSPHRAMFLTGLRPEQNGVTLNVHSESAEDGVGLRDGVATWASVLRDAGYRTGYIGKWHLESPVPDDERFGEGRRDDGKVWDAWSPPERRFGFDFWHSYGAADRHLAPHYWTADAGRDARVDVDAWSAEHEVDVALDFLATPREEPYALMVSLNPPHQPFDQVPECYRRLYADRTAEELLVRPNVPHGTAVAAEAEEIARDYFAAVTGVDEQIGRLAAAIEASGRPTVLLFTADHGMQLGSHGLLYKNVAHEESMRLPLIVHAPGIVPPGVCDATVSSLDFAPTILGLAGLDAGTFPGHDRAPQLRGEAGAADDPVVYYRYASRSDPSSARGLRTPDAKLVATWHPDDGLSVEYCDLVADPYELHSRSDAPEAAHLARALLAELAAGGDAWAGHAALAATYAD
ncbi:sulfatase family protein [Microbacterium bovistercoris]|uniref:sulfatase family protein n=1 Tax=Microbacterium bovistercoris TaxID=2293570 RepID=UPI0015F29C16|nr:sulfatase [Microbacterium bovistercoris]